MAELFLQLEIDRCGIQASVIEQGFNKSSVKDECMILFDDLPELEDGVNPLGAAMELIGLRLNLEKCTTACIYMNHQSISFRTLDLPFTNTKKISQILPFEMESQLPLADREYISDFYRPGLENNSHLILTASMPETDVETCFSVLKTFKIRPVLITHKGYAAATGFFNENKKISNAVFIYLTRQGSTLVLSVDSKPCMVRTFNTLQSSPEILAKKVKQALIGFKQRTGLAPEFEIIVRAGDDSLNAYPVYICIQDALDMRFQLKQTLEMHPHTSAMDYEPSLMAGKNPDPGIEGLLNLCTGKFRPDSFIRTHFVQMAASIALLLVLIALLMVNVGLENKRLETRVAGLDQKAVSIFKSCFPHRTTVKDAYFEMKANVGQALKKAGTAGRSSGAKVMVLDVINELSGKIDPGIDMEISRFLLNDGRLILSGSTDNFNNVDRIKTLIESSSLFKKVDIGSAAAQKKTSRIKFKFNIEL